MGSILAFSIRVGACATLLFMAAMRVSSAELPVVIQQQSIAIRAANAAENAKNYAEALRLWREIDSGTPDVISRTLPPGRVDDYRENIAWARWKIGFYYMKGLSVTINYAEAARWYQHSIDITPDVPFAITNRFWLGLLYAYGLGVPHRDLDKARELLRGHPEWIKVIDYNMQPQNFTDVYNFNVYVAANRIDDERVNRTLERNLRGPNSLPPKPNLYDK